LVDPHLEPLGVRDEEVVANQLNLTALRLGLNFPAVPVVLVHSIFDADDGVLRTVVLVDFDEPCRIDRLLVEGVDATLLVVELACCAVEGDGNLIAGSIPRGFNRKRDERERLLVGREVGCKPPFVADSRRMSRLFEKLPEAVNS
jgi:hypothetical protein